MVCAAWREFTLFERRVALWRWEPLVVDIASPFRLLISAHGAMTTARTCSFCCDHYRSVSEVCRRLRLNRQQFNRYLAGSTAPSRHNHRRISDFFGLEEHELLMPHEAFAETFARRAAAQTAAPGTGSSTPPSSVTRRGRARATFTNIVAFYFKYFFLLPGQWAHQARTRSLAIRWRHTCVVGKAALHG